MTAKRGIEPRRYTALPQIAIVIGIDIEIEIRSWLEALLMAISILNHKNTKGTKDIFFPCGDPRSEIGGPGNLRKADCNHLNPWILGPLAP